MEAAASYAVSTVGFAVEFAWAAGETTVVPFLVSTLHVPFSTAALVFAVNPCVAVFLQPLIGEASDRMQRECEVLGGRLPFILLFSILSVIGIGTLFVADTVVPTCCIAAVCFVAFGTLDVSHDVLLIPSRALISDLSATHGNADASHSRFSTLQAVGRLAALTLGAIPSLYITGDLPAETEAMHFLMGWAAICILLSCAASMAGGVLGNPARFYTELHDEEEGGGLGMSSSGSNRDAVNWHAVAKLVFLQCVGWIGFMVTCFYWTQWVPIERTLSLAGYTFSESMFGLCIGALSGCISGLLNTYANEVYGVHRVYAACLLLNGATLLTAPWLSSWWAVAALIPQGVSYPIHQTNGQLLLMGSMPPSRAGLASSMATYSITLSQIVAAVLAAACGSTPWLGLQGLFAVSGLVCLTGACLTLAPSGRAWRE